MASSAISSVMASTTSAVTTTSTKNKTDQDDFMTLLLAQLKNQDPLEPMDSTAMMSQLAQLNSLNALLAIQSSLDELNKSQSMSYASSLLGKTITAIPDVNDTSSAITGVVTSMLTENGKTTVQVDGNDIDISSIVAVEAE
jgi:flagellar basal-body rod modification protein FlgD